jgi:hypothetical protein
MPERGKPRPAWADEDRELDMALIQENVEMLQIASASSFIEAGRCAIVVETSIMEEDGWHTFAYYPQEVVELDFDDDKQRMVQEYEPFKEFVIVFLKPENRTSTYRIRTIVPDSQM